MKKPSAAPKPAAAPARVRPPARSAKQSPAGPAIRLTNSDPRFKKAILNLEKSAARALEHPPASQKAAEAQAAALPPANEKLSGAQANQVTAMQQAETGKPETSSFLQMLRAEIKKATPKKTEDVEDFMEGDDREQLKGAMAGNIDEQKSTATVGLQAASEQAPDPSRVIGKEVTPLASPPAPSASLPVGAAEAMPTPLPQAEVETSAKQVATDFQSSMAEAKVTPNQLRKANDPRFTAVLTTKAKVEGFADTAPGQFRAQERGALGRAQAGAGANERAGLAAFQSRQLTAGGAVQARQLDAKAKDEQRRQKVADDIEALYTETKTAVDKKLESLETDVSTLFDAGADGAVTAMRNYVDTRFDERYGGVSGKALWLKDKLLPLPDEVQAWFDEAYTVFLAALDALVVRVADLVETRLKEAKAEIDKGQQRIRAYVEALPKDLQEVGKTAEAEVQARFDEMRKGVDDKKADLARKLAQRYQEASDKGAAALKEMRDAHKSLYEQAKEVLGEVIEVLRNFKKRIMALIKKAESAIDLIAADPIGFLENLLNAVKQGLNQFVDNIWTHLKAGLMTWLFGTLTKAGVTPPKDFSLPSILQLVLQILGLTYDRIRIKAVKLIGERNVMLFEKAWEIISTLIKGGPAALWEQVKEYLSDLKAQVVDAIQDWLITSIIKAAVTKLVSMFNPIGAIIQAILTIYQVVTFFIEKINQIMAFVEAIVESVYNIATGAIGPAANWIEQALARTIPLIIDFLARLLGLSGVSEKIKEIVQKIQAKVDKAIDKLIEKVVAGVKGITSQVRQSKKPGSELAIADQQFAMSAVAHSLKIVKNGTQYQLVMESDPAILREKVEAAMKYIRANKGKYGAQSVEETVVLGELEYIFRVLTRFDAMLHELTEVESKAETADVKKMAFRRQELEQNFERIAGLLGMFGEKYGLSDLKGLREEIEVSEPDVKRIVRKETDDYLEVELRIRERFGDEDFFFAILTIPGPQKAEKPVMYLSNRPTRQSGLPVKLRIKLTDTGLHHIHEEYWKKYGIELTEIHGNLGESNLKNFQSEFAKFMWLHGQGDFEAGQNAIRKISYGTDRVARGYTDFKVDLKKFTSQKVEIAETRLEAGMKIHEAEQILLSQGFTLQIASRTKKIVFIAKRVPEIVDIKAKRKLPAQ